MAQGLQPQRVVRRLAAALAVGATVAACGDDHSAAPRLAARLDAKATAEAVLAACHAPLRGQMNDVALTLTIGGEPYRVSAALPDRLRTAGPNGAYLLVGQRAWRLDEQPPVPADATRRDWLLTVRDLVDAAAMGPLHRCSTPTLVGTRLRLPDADRVDCTLELRADSALPASWTFGERAVVVREFLHTGSTWMAAELFVEPLGRVDVAFDRAGVVWSTDFFASPDDRAAGGDLPRVILPSQGGAEARSATPTPGRATALRLVVLPDPGDWESRAAAYAPVHAELERQNQRIAGFPMLFTDGEQAILAAPFRRRPDGPAFVPPDGWQLRDWPDQELLVVYPSDGDFATKRERGAAQLREALLGQGRTAKGPIVTQPFFHLQEGVPSAAKLAAPVVRISVACTPP